MAITPQHQKGEPGPTELEKAYNRARSIGLFLVEKHAREVLREHPEFDMEDSHDQLTKDIEYIEGLAKLFD
jgi:hypothetical protein